MRADAPKDIVFQTCEYLRQCALFLNPTLRVIATGSRARSTNIYVSFLLIAIFAFIIWATAISLDLPFTATDRTTAFAPGSSQQLRSAPDLKLSNW